MDIIPRDVQLHIFSYLSYWHLDLALVSKKWRRLYWHRRGNNLLYGNGAPTAQYWQEFFSEVDPKTIKYLSVQIPQVENSILQDGLLSKLLINLETLIVDIIPSKREDAFFTQLPLLTRLRNLNFANHKDLNLKTDSVLKLAACTQLESLALPQNCKQLSELRSLTNLQELNFFYFGKDLTRLADAQMMFDALTQLKKLNVSLKETKHMFNIDKLTGLKELTVEISDTSMNDNILTVEKGFSMSPLVKLDKLHLKNVAFVQEIDGLKNTKELNIEFFDATHSLYMIDFGMFSEMTNLQKLRIGAWMLVCEQEWEPLTNLTSLTFTGESCSTDDFSKIFITTPNLKELYIQITAQTKMYDFQDLELLKRLQHFKSYGILPEDEKILLRLKERNFRILGLDATKFAQQHFNILGKFDTLTTLAITNINVRATILDLTQIFLLPNLEVLYLQFIGAVSQEDYEKWLTAAHYTKLRIFINRNEYFRDSSWQKIFQGDKWMWIRLSNLESKKTPLIKALSAYTL